MSYKRQLTNHIYEQRLVRKLNYNNWTARMLREPNGMNCIIAVNNQESVLLAISSHVGTYNIVVVLQNQISYCLKTRDLFEGQRVLGCLAGGALVGILAPEILVQIRQLGLAVNCGGLGGSSSQ